MRLRTSSQQQQQNKKPSGTDVVLKEPKLEPNSEPSASESLPQAMEIDKSSVCYCNGTRKLGDLEVHCCVCHRWFHQACFRDLENFGGLPFMVSYIFTCQQCSTDGKEKWNLRSTSFSTMAVMALANMTYAYRNTHFQQQEEESNECGSSPAAPRNPYFNIETQIVPYLETNWEYLSTTPRRQKRSWHSTITKILQKETELFEQDPNDENGFALREQDLLRIGPMHESVTQLFKRSRDAAEREAQALQIGEQQLQGAGAEPAATPGQFAEGPKTRGASRRKAAAISAGGPGGEGQESSPKSQQGQGGGSALKKAKIAAEFATGQFGGQPVDFPFNREGYRYYLVEKDPTIPNREQFDTEEVSNTRAVQIPQHIFRIMIFPTVQISPNDRANQLQLEEDGLTLTGHEGYSMARATHSVAHGCWYYEMEFLSQPAESHVRVGWAQAYSVLQACVGYTKFSYGLRSKKGTKFHDGYGRHYSPLGGFGQGDVVGCLIELPPFDGISGPSEGRAPSELLPKCRKDCDLIKFKQNYFFEEKEEVQEAMLKLKPLPGSKVEFFLNGLSLGPAFECIYGGHYFPAVSLYQGAKVRLNFGPDFQRVPDCVRQGRARPMSERPEEMGQEQAMADIVYMVDNEAGLERRNLDYFNAILTKENATNGVGGGGGGTGCGQVLMAVKTEY